MALVGDGFVSGLVLAPVLHMSSIFAPDIVPAALILTTLMFAGVSVSVMITKVQYSAPKGLMMGLFFALADITILNMFLKIGFLGILIACGIGVSGVFILINGTSQVLNSPDYDES